VCEAVQKEQRLRTREEFAAVQKEGKSWVHPLLIMRARRNEVGFTRFGVAVGKRVGNAVARNRVKRWLREVVRVIPNQGSWDVVIVAREGAAEADFHQVREAIVELLARARLTKRAVREAGGD